MKTLEEKKKLRFLFLKEIYQRKNSADLQVEQTQEICELLGISFNEGAFIAEYLSEEGLIRTFTELNDCVAITHRGIVEIEEALSEPEKPTEHFLPINIISVQTMTNSQITQGSTNSTQTQNITQNQGEKLSEFVKLFEQKVAEIQFCSNDDKNEAIAEVSTIKSQLDSPKPKWEIIKSAGNSIKRILEKAAAIELVEKLKDLF